MREDFGGGSALAEPVSVPVANLSTVPVKPRSSARLPLIDALRAMASTLIAWHHFTFYPPLVTEAAPLCGGVLEWVKVYGRVAQVFFVVSGYILSLMMAKKYWDARAVGRFFVQRYCRLGLPYLGAIACAIPASAFARGWIDLKTAGSAPTWQQLLAHVFFLQDILDYEPLSAGLWFVCITMQLSVVFVAGLWLRDFIGHHAPEGLSGTLSYMPMAIGWMISASTLFYFNLDDRWDPWFVYFFAQFFLGVMVYAALARPEFRIWALLYALMFVAAIGYEWRSRLVMSLATGLLLYAGGQQGFMKTWPKSSVIEYLGRTSYSLFLVHFPVFLVVATVWAMLGWKSPGIALAGLFVTYFASIAASAVFYRWVESPAARLSHRWGSS